MSKTPSTVAKPFDLHILICTNTRGPGQKQSCGPLGGDTLRADLKEWLRGEIAIRPKLKNHVKSRVNGSGCLDFCSRGIAIALYPSAEFLVDVTLADTEWVKNRLRQKLDQLEAAI